MLTCIVQAYNVFGEVVRVSILTSYDVLCSKAMVHYGTINDITG